MAAPDKCFAGPRGFPNRDSRRPFQTGPRRLLRQPVYGCAVSPLGHEIIFSCPHAAATTIGLWTNDSSVTVRDQVRGMPSVPRSVTSADVVYRDRSHA